MQGIVGFGIGREPIFAIDLLAVRLELRELVRILLTIPTAFPTLHDLQVAIVDQIWPSK